MNPPPLYAASVPVLLRYLGTLERVLQAVGREGHARTPQILAARLAPGMMPLAAQVDTAAHLALRTALPLADEAVPAFEASEPGLAGLAGTLGRTSARLRQLPPDRFAHAEGRVITERAGSAQLALPAWTFLGEFALPNLLFHVSMAYAIARHEGCALGKAQFDGFHRYDEP